MLKSITFRFLAFLSLLILFGCTSPKDATNSKLRVVATTTLIGDVAENIGGDLIDLSVMMPTGADPHSFEPTPAELGEVTDADLVLVNGIGFEAFLDKLIENASDETKIVTVSEGIETIALDEITHDHHDEEPSEEAHTYEHGEFDPHVWHDPHNVIIWANNIATALGERDPTNAATYRANADAYITQLQTLDTWIEEQITQVPETNRRLVTEHGTLNYFAARYGFEIVGAAIPGFSTLAEPSAQELAALADAISNLDVKAILVGNTVNNNITTQIAQDIGIQLIPIYTDSLSPTDGPATTYLDFIQYNVEAIVEGLK